MTGDDGPHHGLNRPKDSANTMKTRTPRPVYLKDYQPSHYLIDRIDLNVLLEPSKTRVTSKLKVRSNPKADVTGAALELDGEHISLEQVKLSGRKLDPSDYFVNDRQLIIPRVPNNPFTIETTVTCNPESNKALSGLYRSKDIYCTQCEAEGFRRITYFIDRPDVLSIYTTRVEAQIDEAPVLLSNGNCAEFGQVDGTTRHYAIWHDPFPKPSYLFALVGGDLRCKISTFTTQSGRAVDLRIYVEPGKENRCDWAMDSLKRSMRWDEKRFGREYDLDIFMIVAVSDFNMGAMENKGLNIFNDKLILASPETATDGDYAAIEAVIAHEYFHNWTGNRVTCRDWFQLCLKEGLTVFRDQEFSSDERSRTVERISEVRTLKAHQFPEDAGPLAHPVLPNKYIEINNFYTATVYEKGAEICRMIQTIVGESGFRKGMDLYFTRHDGEAATVEQFIACFEEVCDVDLTQFMRWYTQAGTPELFCELAHDAEREVATLAVQQVLPATPGQSRKSPLHIPLKIGLLDDIGLDLKLELVSGQLGADSVLHLTKRHEKFQFKNIKRRPVPSLLREFSSPVYANVDLSDGDLEFLITHDSDLFNRWQSAQSYAIRLIIQMVEAIKNGKHSKRGLPFARALASTLAHNDLEPAYRAQFISLPSEADVARRIAKDVDPEAIHRASMQLRRIVGRTLQGELLDTYKRHKERGPYFPDAKSAGRRALRNAALVLLAASDETKAKTLISKHYRSAKNMTDRTAALQILSHLRGKQRDQAFDDFYKEWRDDHLVIDKWFAYQAMSSLPNTVETVKKLYKHQLFSIKNPNKVRALIGAFAMSNQLNFHRPDGAGYDFVADKVMEIDTFNPQIAARLLGAFRSWRALESKRRAYAKKVLQRIAKSKVLSRDVYEIVTRMVE